MSLTGQPEFAARGVPTPTQLNAWMATITAKFVSLIGTADLAWPMFAGGHLNMNGNSFDKIPRLGAVYNLAQRRHWQTTKMIFNEVEARGGGTVLLPGNTTIAAQAEKDGFTGIRVGNNIWYRGHGYTSVSGQLYMDSKSNIRIEDMLINNLSTLKNCENITFRRCTFNGTGVQQVLLVDCKNVKFFKCNFVGAATTQVEIKNSLDTTVRGCYFEDYGDLAIHAKVEGVMGGNGLRIRNNVFYHPSAYGGSTNYCVKIEGVNLRSAIAGTASWKFAVENLKNIFSNNMLLDLTGGLRLANVRHFMISKNYFGDTSTSAIMVYVTQPEHADSRIYAHTRTGTQFQANVISLGSDVGVQIEQARQAIVRGNVIFCADQALVLEQQKVNAPVSLFDDMKGGGLNTIHGNVMWTNDAALPAMTIWNLNETPTKQFVKTCVTYNHLDGTSGVGYQSFINAGVTAGGEIGDTQSPLYKPWWTFVGNNSQGTTVSGGANEDMAHSVNNQSIVLKESDGTTPINNI